MSDMIGPKSLRRLALAVALRNVSTIVDVGLMPFEVAQPILKAIENPVQLHQLELNCPTLSVDPSKMEEIWRRLLERKYPRWSEQGYDIPDGTSWLDTYYLIKHQVEKSNAEAEAVLAQKFAGFDKAREDKKTEIVMVNSKLLPKQPVVGRRRGQGPVRPKSTVGMTALQKAKTEASRIGRLTTLGAPKGSITFPVAPSKLKTAPPAMVHDHRVSANPEIKMHPPKRPNPPSPELLEKESRLLAAKSAPAASAKSPAKRATPDNDDGDGDDHAPSKRARTDGGTIGSRAASPLTKTTTAASSKRSAGLLSSTRPPAGVIRKVVESPAGPSTPAAGAVRKTGATSKPTFSPAASSEPPAGPSAPVAGALRKIGAISKPAFSSATSTRSPESLSMPAPPKPQLRVSVPSGRLTKNGRGIIAPRSRSATPKSSTPKTPGSSGLSHVASPSPDWPSPRDTSPGPTQMHHRQPASSASGVLKPKPKSVNIFNTKAKPVR